MASASDVEKKLSNLAEYAKFYRSQSERVAKRGGDPENHYVSYPEMAGVLADIHFIFKHAFGVGQKRNQIGQAHAPKRGWETHG